MFLVQHAHIENIKTVANLSNNKDVFMCILRFHARADYLQLFERPCSRKFCSILRHKRISRSLSISTTWSDALLLTAITMCPVNRGSDIHPW